MKQGLQLVPVSPMAITFYEGVVDQPLLDEVIELARPLKGKKVVMLNATAYGGGVSEIFSTFVPVIQSLGIDVEWRILPIDMDFFEITKSLHNALQGADYDFTAAAKKTYLDYNRKVAEMLTELKADIYEIHDPQPLAVIEYNKLPNSIWRCHIDTTAPNKPVWDFLSTFIKKYDELIFTLPEFAHEDLAGSSLNFITPTIDPLSVKNAPLELDTAREIVKTFGIDVSRPLITQVSRFDPWKDPRGVIDAYRLAKKMVKGLQLALVGSMAHDDPEGAEILLDIEKYAGKDPDIYILTNLGGVGEIEVNAFQTYSGAIIQKSLREGFGLTVSEGMWKKKPVIGGNVGGIKVQIEDGKTGFLVNSVEECADRIVESLKGGAKIDMMGQKAHDYVKKNFTHPRLIRDHLRLWHKLLDHSQ